MTRSRRFVAFEGDLMGRMTENRQRPRIETDRRLQDTFPAWNTMKPNPIARINLPELDIGVLQPEDCDLNEEYGTLTTGPAPEEPVDFPLAEAEVKGTSPSCRMVRDGVYGFHNG